MYTITTRFPHTLLYICNNNNNNNSRLGYSTRRCTFAYRLTNMYQNRLLPIIPHFNYFCHNYVIVTCKCYYYNIHVSYGGISHCHTFNGVGSFCS